MTDHNTTGRNNHVRAIIDHATAHRAAVQGELLTITEVATLRYWSHLGTGPHNFRIGRTVRYWHHNVTTWLQQQSSASDQPRPRNKEVKPAAGRGGEPGPATFERSSRGSGHPETLRAGLGKGVPTTFGGTSPRRAVGQGDDQGSRGDHDSHAGHHRPLGSAWRRC